MTPVWRLIDDGPVEGAWNMALDRAVQLAREEGSSPATLRLYRWTRPTVTLGRFQSIEGVDLGVTEREGVDVVRRFTGGRGVLHDREVTYSIVAGVEDGVPRGVAASYRHLCGGLAEAYALLGVQAQLTARPRGEGSSPACYLHATAADLSLGALKLSGSAQVWHGSTVMQHGSFVVERDVEREAQVFGLSEPDARRLAAETVTLADVLECAPDEAEIRRCVVQGVEQAFGVRLVPGSPTKRELEIAETLLPQTDATVVPSRSVRA